MELKEYINYFEEELDRLEEHRNGLLEADKSTRYTEAKIDFIRNLLGILHNCKKSEELRTEVSEYRYFKYEIENILNKIKEAKTANEKLEKTKRLLDFLEN